MARTNACVPWLAVLGAACCAPNLQSVWVTDVGVVDGSTEARDWPFTVAPEMQRVVVKLAFTAERGDADWSLVDPSGVVQWQYSTVTARQARFETAVPATPGTWTVRRQWRAFAGSQDLAIGAKAPD